MTRFPTKLNRVIVLALVLAAGAITVFSIHRASTQTDTSVQFERAYEAPVTHPVIEPDRPDLIGEPRIENDP